MVVFRHPSFGWPWLGLAIVLLCQLAADRWALSTNAVSVDYFTLWSVPRALPTLGDRDIYAPDTQREMATIVRTMTTTTWSSAAQRRSMAASDQLYAGRIDATATPFAYTVVGVASSGDYDRDLGRYRWASLLAFIGAVLILGSLLQFPPSVTITALVALSLGSAPLLAELRVANINQFQLLSVALALWCVSRRWLAAAGIVLGVAVMFKPTVALVPVALLGLALADRRYRAAGLVTAGVAAGVGLAVASASLYFDDWQIWPRFAESLARTLDAEYPLAHGNFGLAAVAASQWRLDISLVVAGLVGAAFLGVTILSRPSATGDAPPAADGPALTEWLAAAGIACGAMLLASRLVWLHYFLLLVPLVLLLMRPVEPAEDFKPRRYAGIAAGVVALLLLSPVAQSLAGDPLRVALFANLATIILVAAALDDLWRARRARAEALAAQSTPPPKRRRRAADRAAGR